VQHYLWLVSLGSVLGAFGTLVGAGGGFVLVPVLLILYPHEGPEIITSISLAVVFFNALSGTVAYARMKRIDYVSGLMFSTVSIPGAIIGAITTYYIPRRLFDAIFGFLMMVVSGFLLIRPSVKLAERPIETPHGLMRKVSEANGTVYTFSYKPGTGLFLSACVGYISSLLGIGGGIIHVPAMVRLLNFPVHIATATSHFVLAIMALAGTSVHVIIGSFHHGLRRTIALSIGVLLGAQIGARLSDHMQDSWIIRLLSLALALVAVRLLIMAFLSIYGP
jgi:hypothetical protein